MKRSPFLLLVATLGVAAVTHAQPMGGAPGGAQMPDPRMMSGQARPQEGDPPGRLTVRAVQGKLRVDELGNRVSDWPKDGVVHLVAYDTTDHVEIVSKPLDAEGRAIFDGLATDGSRAYRALAIFARPASAVGVPPGGPTEDRLVSQTIVMPPQVGLRVMLAGEAVDSTAPAADDHTRTDEFGDGKTPAAGEVIIRLRGQTKGAGQVHLVRIGAAGEVGVADAIINPIVLGAKAEVAAPTVDPALRDGLVQVRMTRKGNPKDPDHSHGAVGATVELRSVAAAATAPPHGTATTGGDGVASFEGLKPGTRYALRVVIHGVAADSKPFEIPPRGGVVVPAEASWADEQSLEARFSGVPGGADRAYYAWLTVAGKTYASIPLQLTQALGAATGIFVYPSLVFSFHGGAELDDQKMFFQMQISLINPTNSPRDVGPGGLRIPFPRGFRAASVDETMAARVKVMDDGLVWRGPLAPGQRDFMAGFALDVQGGEISFELPLPLGAWQSQLVFEDVVGMTMTVPESAHKRKVNGQNGRPFVVLGDINIEPGKSLVMRVHGLPTPSAFQRWAKLVVGFAVLAFLGWAAMGIFRRGGVEVDRTGADRERLYAELVVLEEEHARKQGDEGRYGKRRAKLIERLAALSAEGGSGGRAGDDAGGGAASGRP